MCVLCGKSFKSLLNGGSYMSAQVLMYSLSELRKRVKMRDLLSILSPFRNELNIFNNIGAQMLYSIYYMTLKLL